MSATDNNPTVSDDKNKQDEKEKDDPMLAETQDNDTNEAEEKKDSKSDAKEKKSEKSKGKDPKGKEEDEEEKDEESGEEEKKKPKKKRRAKSPSAKKREFAEAAETVNYEINEIVWAKVKDRRWWPARIVDEANAPKKLVAKKQASKMKSPTLVHFLDSNLYFILGKKDLKKWEDPQAAKFTNTNDKKPAGWTEAHKLTLQFKNGEYTPPPPKEEEEQPKKLLGKRKRTEFTPVALGKNILEEIIKILEDKDTEDAQIIVLLDILSKLSPTIQELSNTQLGKKLRPLTKHANKDIKSRATDLKKKYKEFIKEEVDKFHEREVVTKK